MKRTYQPKKLQRKHEHGFMKRMATKNGRKVLARRRAKGRKRLTHWSMTESGKFRKRYVVIKSNRDFSYLFKKGDSTVNYAFVCYMKPRRAGKNRLGIVTGKKVGNAVKRNRSRRIIREAFRLFEPILKENTDRRFDFVFVARAKTPMLKTQQILSLMIKNILPKLQWNIFFWGLLSCTS